MKLKSEEKKAEKTLFLYRALIAQRKFNTVISEIPDSTAQPSLKAIKLLAQYFQSPAKRAAIAEEAKQLLAAQFEPTVALLVATVFYLEKNFDETLRALHSVNTLERYALFPLYSYLPLCPSLCTMQDSFIWRS